MIPMTQAQEPSTETSSNPSASPSIEEIQVFGIRRSLESALEEKRFTTNLTEIINAMILENYRSKMSLKYSKIFQAFRLREIKVLALKYL
ncbi:MAG: hypothetical protein CM15mP51_22240 [Porticoccaceae bacterium]|nr:MAG: hypothetical protein CM15mP51_22240 [Porticoccaceae bacterium]